MIMANRIYAVALTYPPSTYLMEGWSPFGSHFQFSRSSSDSLKKKGIRGYYNTQKAICSRGFNENSSTFQNVRGKQIQFQNVQRKIIRKFSYTIFFAMGFDFPDLKASLNNLAAMHGQKPALCVGHVHA